MTNIKRKEEVKKDIADILTDPNTGQSYNRGKFLGKGGFARCYELTDPITKKIYAGKIVSKSLLTKQHQKEKMTQEIAIHRSLNHKHIVGFHKFFEDPENVYIILELCRRRSLMEFHKRRKAVTEPETRYFLRQLLLGVKHLHDFKVIHRDLKLGNLFINDDMELKIGDFGLATRVGFEGERKRTLCGTPNYIAPEILCKKGHSYEVDVWSIGCILYTLLVGKPPFETQTLKETYTRIKKNEYHIPSRIGPLARNLIQRLLQEDPSRRPSVEEILKDDFMTLGFIPSRLPTSCLTMAPRFDAHLNRSIVATRKPLLELNSKGVDNFLGEREGYNCSYSKVTLLKSENDVPNYYDEWSYDFSQLPYQNVMAENENFESFNCGEVNLNENLKSNDLLSESEIENTRYSNGAKLSHIFDSDFYESNNIFGTSNLSGHQYGSELDLLTHKDPSLLFQTQNIHGFKKCENKLFVDEIMNGSCGEQCTIIQKTLPADHKDASKFAMEFVNLQRDSLPFDVASTGSLNQFDELSKNNWSDVMKVSTAFESPKVETLHQFIMDKTPIHCQTEILTTHCRSKNSEILEYLPSKIEPLINSQISLAQDIISYENICENDTSRNWNIGFRKSKIDLLNFNDDEPEDSFAKPSSSQYIMSFHRLSSPFFRNNYSVETAACNTATLKSDVAMFNSLLPRIVSDDEYVAATTLLEMNSGWSQNVHYNEYFEDSIMRTCMPEFGNKSDSSLDITGIISLEPCCQRSIYNSNDESVEYLNNLSLVSSELTKDHGDDTIAFISKASKDKYLISFNSNSIEDARIILGAVAIGRVNLNLPYLFFNDLFHRLLTTKNFNFRSSDAHTAANVKLPFDLHSFIRNCEGKSYPQISSNFFPDEHRQELSIIMKSHEETCNIIVKGNARRKLVFLTPPSIIKDLDTVETGEKIVLGNFETPVKTKLRCRKNNSRRHWSSSSNEVACKQRQITSTPFYRRSDFTSVSMDGSFNKTINCSLVDQDRNKQMKIKLVSNFFSALKSRELDFGELISPLSDFVSFDLGCQSVISTMLYSSLGSGNKEFYSDESSFYSMGDYWISSSSSLSLKTAPEFEQIEDTLSSDGKKVNSKNHGNVELFDIFCGPVFQNLFSTCKLFPDPTVKNDFFMKHKELVKSLAFKEDLCKEVECDANDITVPFTDFRTLEPLNNSRKKELFPTDTDYNSSLSCNCCLDKVKLEHGKENSIHKLMQSCSRSEMETNVSQTSIMLANEKGAANNKDSIVSDPIFDLSASNLDLDLDNLDCDSLQEFLSLDGESFLQYFEETDKLSPIYIDLDNKTDLQTSYGKQNNCAPSCKPSEFDAKIICQKPSATPHNDSLAREKIPVVRLTSMDVKKSLFRRSRKDRKKEFHDCAKKFSAMCDNPNSFSEWRTADEWLPQNLIENASLTPPTSFKSPFVPDFHSTPFTGNFSFPFKWEFLSDSYADVVFNCAYQSVAMPQNIFDEFQSNALDLPKNKRSSDDFLHCKRLKLDPTAQYTSHSVSNMLTPSDGQISEESIWRVKRKPVKNLNNSGKPKLILKFQKVCKR